MPQTNRSFLDRVINLEADDHLLQTNVDESLSMDSESSWDGPTSDQFMSSPEFSGNNVVAQDFQPQNFQQSTTEQPTEYSWPVSTMEQASIQPTTEFSTESTPSQTVPAQTFEFGTEQVAQQPVATPAQPAATQQAATGTPSPFGGSIRSYYQWLKQRKQQQSYTNVTGDQVDNR
jgi:hypothetical protein